MTSARLLQQPNRYHACVNTGHALASHSRLARSDWLVAGAIFTIALAVRLMFLFGSPDRAWPHSLWYEGDAPTWVTWAAALDQGQPFEFNLPLRSPAVAYLMHWLAPGHAGQVSSTGQPRSFVALKTLWCVASAATGALLYLTCALHFDRRVGLIAAGMLTVAFGSYVQATSLNNEALYTLTLVTIIMCIQALTVAGNIWMAFALGVLHGLAMLVRPEHMLLFLMMLCYLAVQSGILGSKHGNTVSVMRIAPLRDRLRAGKAALICTVFAAAIVVCLPWSIRGSLATQAFNRGVFDAPNYESADPPWTNDAVEYLESLPPYTRNGSFRYLNHLALQEGKSIITREDVQQFFVEQFQYVPEPLPEWTFVSMKGPLDFALANHPKSGGVFSKVALARPGDTDPTIVFGRPDHLRLINAGYSVGLEYITSDVSGWLRQVATKLSNFIDGASLGFTAYNLPLGLTGVRRPVDQFTPQANPGTLQKWTLIAWKVLFVVVITVGAAIALRLPAAQPWLLVIAYKIIVAVLFYGYARQGASILPAFYVLVALAIDQAMRWLSIRWSVPHGKAWTAIAVLLLTVLAIEVSAAVRNRGFNAVGPVRPAPHLGNGAFESYETLRISPAARSS